ncbi:MAG TPA: thermonuclease family protein [Sphingomicrobium sp.]|nr:thermonuclease family protein [Sphingomicrobium sp.]
MSKHWPPDNVSRGRFGRSAPSRDLGAPDRGDWLSSETYDALTAAEKRTLRHERADHPPQYGHRRTHRRAKPRQWPLAAGLVAMMVVGEFGLPRLKSAPAAPATPLTTSFDMCKWGSGYNCVVDGDTIWIEGQNVRIADIDAPETHEPRCAEERVLGDRATVRLRQLLNSGEVRLANIDRDMDVYGRKLRIVEVDGASVGGTLVGEGLARWYAGGRRPWC